MTDSSIKSITDHICVKTRRLTRRSEYKKQTTTSLVKELKLWRIKKDNISSDVVEEKQKVTRCLLLSGCFWDSET